MGVTVGAMIELLTMVELVKHICVMIISNISAVYQSVEVNKVNVLTDRVTVIQSYHSPCHNWLTSHRNYIGNWFEPGQLELESIKSNIWGNVSSPLLSSPLMLHSTTVYLSGLSSLSGFQLFFLPEDSEVAKFTVLFISWGGDKSSVWPRTLCSPHRMWVWYLVCIQVT